MANIEHFCYLSWNTIWWSAFLVDVRHVSLPSLPCLLIFIHKYSMLSGRSNMVALRPVPTGHTLKLWLILNRKTFLAELMESPVAVAKLGSHLEKWNPRGWRIWEGKPGRTEVHIENKKWHSTAYRVSNPYMPNLLMGQELKVVLLQKTLSKSPRITSTKLSIEVLMGLLEWGSLQLKRQQVLD